MEKRVFGKPPGVGAKGKVEIKSELFTKIGTRTAVITAHYEYIPAPVPNIQLSDSNSVVAGTSDFGLKVKQIRICENPSEIIYDYPKNQKSIGK